ncbi:neutral amino acid permease [Diplodia corticola]|uniref:Neutral amino acid permease n=1 Tax=Diplodia corticola TaxID=236234 RepID=A0A1J9RJW9_9PEZI|nr:neutral amino acid permease [Diplodia corticola]OJD40290.1 neutral amino acid permease [Diplodia corticola]
MAETVGVEDIEKMWETALKTYKERTGDDLNHSANLTLEEMEAELSKSFQGGDTRDDIVKKSLESIIQAGAEILSDVASNAFPGAGVLFKAVTPLIEITHNYQKYYTPRSVHDILEDILPHFNRIETWVESTRQGARLSRNLVELIFQTLEHFLNICAIYRNIVQTSEHRKGRFKNFCKAVIGLDQGIKEEVDHLERLAKHERAQTEAESHGYLLVDEDRRARARYQKSISDNLEIEETTQFLDQWTETQTKLQKEYVKGIGSWLPALDEFSTWADVCQAAAPVLMLEADPGFGKTYLCSEIIKKLQDGQMPEKHRMSSIAFFYFKSSEKGRISKGQTANQSQGAAKDSPTSGPIQDDQVCIRDALISLIWQLTLVDDEYQKFVASKMELPTSRFPKSKELWERLVKEYATFAGSKRRKIFFLIIDGLDLDQRTAEEQDDFKFVVQDIMKMPRSEFQIRILITGKKDILSNLQISDSKDSTLIHVAEHRQGDMKAFIKYRLRAVPKDWKDKEQVDLLRQIETKFCDCEKYTSGSYLHVSSLLDEVAHTYGNNELRDILKRHPEDSCSAVAWQLKRVEGQLSGDEIEEFNDILICMVLLEVWPNIKQLATFAWDKYLHFFTLYDDDIVESEPTMKYFIDRHPPEPEPIFANETFSQGENYESDVALIKRLARAFCQGELPARLEQFFKSLPASTPRIDLDCVDGHVKIVLCVLRAVCTERRKNSVFLHEYAAFYLLSHFGKVTTDQLRQVTADVKTEIGYHLHEFFMDQVSVNTWMKQDLSDSALDTLFLAEQQQIVHDALRWQEGEDVRKGIGMAAKQNKYCSQASMEENIQGSGGEGKSDEKATHGDDLSQAGELSIDLEETEHAAEITHDPGNISSTEEVVQHQGPAQDLTVMSANERDRQHDAYETDTEANEQARLEIHQVIQAPRKALAYLWLDGVDFDAETSIWKLIRMSRGNFGDLEVCSADRLSKISRPSLELIWKWAIGVLGDADNIKTSNRLTRLAETVLAIRKASLEEQHTDSEPWQTRPSGEDDDYEYIAQKCQLAKREDPNNWRATWCIAKAQMQQRHAPWIWPGEHPALETLEQLLEEFQKKNLRNEDRNQHDKILSSFLELCENKSLPYRAVRAFGSLFEKFPNDMDLVKRGFDWVMAQKDRICLKKLIHILVMTPEKGGCSPMTNLLHKLAESQEFHGNLWLALYDDLGLTIKCYTDAINVTTDISVVARGNLRFYYAVALYHQQKVEDATGMWESIKLERPQFRAHPELRQLQAQISEKLALCYVQLTRSSIKKASASDGETEYIKKVRELIQKGKEGQDTSVTDIRYLTLSLCRIHKLNGQEEEAKSCIGSYVKAAADILVDETYDNDSEGYRALGEIFVALGDEKRAKDAWSMINDTGDGHLFELPIFCDGGCGKRWERYPDTEMHICKDCRGVHLDKTCHEKLKSGKLRQRVCGKDHPFFTVQKWDGKARKEMTSRVAKAGDLVTLTTSWVDEINSQYVVKQTNNQHHHR